MLMVQAQVLDKDQALNGSGIPEGLITLGDASRKYSIPFHVLERRVQRGRLIPEGPRPGRGGGRILVHEADIIAYIEHPPKTGRPPKLVD